MGKLRVMGVGQEVAEVVRLENGQLVSAVLAVANTVKGKMVDEAV